MKNLVLFFLLSISINAQMNEGTSFFALNQYPHTTLKLSGIGSRGFDDDDGIYNSKLSLSDSLLKFSVSGIVNMPILRTYPLDNKTVTYLDNKLDFLPQASFKMILDKSRSFAITINYFSDVLSSVKFGDRSGSTSFRFLTENGTYRVLVDKEKASFYSKNQILQCSILHIVDENSFSLGIQTTAFNYILHWAPLDPFIFNSDLFSNTQFIASLNLNFNENLAGYLTFKSQESRFLMSKQAFFNGEEILTPDTYLSLNGNIGYGIQYKVSDRVKLSAEMSHQFLEVDEENHYDYYTEKLIHHIWNNELFLGAKVKVLENFYAGLVLSYFLRYNNDIGIRFTSENSPFEYTDVPPSKPFTLIASLKYSLANYVLLLQYQHSQTSYINKGSYGNKELYDYGNFFKLTLTANFSALSNFDF